MAKTPDSEDLRNLKPRYAREGFLICGIFGSYARDDFDEQSDVDIAYRLKKESFFSHFRGFAGAVRLAEINREIALALGKRVDLVSLNALNKAMADEILRGMIDA